MRNIIIFTGLLLLFGTSFILSFINEDSDDPQPIVKAATVTANDDNAIDVSIEAFNMGGGIYPASSLSLSFDNSVLRLEKIVTGDIFLNDGTAPEWEADIAYSNKNGLINIMRYDKSGGASSLDITEKSCLMRLIFSKISSAENTSKETEIAVNDCAFAAISPENSLSADNEKIKTINGGVKFE